MSMTLFSPTRVAVCALLAVIVPASAGAQLRSSADGTRASDRALVRSGVTTGAQSARSGPLSRPGQGSATRLATRARLSQRVGQRLRIVRNIPQRRAVAREVSSARILVQYARELPRQEADRRDGIRFYQARARERLPGAQRALTTANRRYQTAQRRLAALQRQPNPDPLAVEEAKWQVDTARSEVRHLESNVSQYQEDARGVDPQEVRQSEQRARELLIEAQAYQDNAQARETAIRNGTRPPPPFDRARLYNLRMGLGIPVDAY